jgi:hypothetical protein
MNVSILTASCSPHCPQPGSPQCSPRAAVNIPCDHLLQPHGQASDVSHYRGHLQGPHSATVTAHTDGDLKLKRVPCQETDMLEPSQG